MKEKPRMIKIKGSEYHITDENGNAIEFGTYIPDSELKDMEIPLQKLKKIGTEIERFGKEIENIIKN